MSADAVSGRAPGLRRLLSRARRPLTGATFCSGHPSHAGDGPDEVPADDRHGHEHEHGAERDGRRGAIVPPGPYMPPTMRSAAQDGDHARRSDRHEAREARRRQRGALLQRRHRRHARGARRRDDRREQRDDDAHGERDDDGARLQHEPAVRDVDAGGLEQLVHAGGDAEPGEQAEHARRSTPITSASPVMLAEHLARATRRARAAWRTRGAAAPRSSRTR